MNIIYSYNKTVTGQILYIEDNFKKNWMAYTEAKTVFFYSCLSVGLSVCILATHRSETTLDPSTRCPISLFFSLLETMLQYSQRHPQFRESETFTQDRIYK